MTDDIGHWGRFFAALWVSETWYRDYADRIASGKPLRRRHNAYRARGVVLFDRIVCGEERRDRLGRK